MHLVSLLGLKPRRLVKNTLVTISRQNLGLMVSFQSAATNSTRVSAKTRQYTPIPYRGAQARQRAAEKVREVLSWLHQSQVIDAAIVGEVLGVGRNESHATLSRLQRMNLVQRVPVSSCPVTPWILTRAGLEVVCSLLEPEDMTDTPPIHPSRVQTATVAHDLLVQHLTLYVMGRIGPLVAEARSDEVMQISPEMIQVNRWAFDPVLRRKQERYAGKIPDAIIEAAMTAIRCRRPSPTRCRRATLRWRWPGECSLSTAMR